jgi:ketosteroid isomerase-like protein
MAADCPYSSGEIADRLAIEQVIARYVHALDARDYDRLDDVFLPDTRLDLSEAGGIVGSWVEVKRYYQDNLAAFVDYQHAFTNVLLEFDAARRSARSRSKVINPCGIIGSDGRPHHFEIVGAYEDVWRRVPDGWRIAERTWRQGWIWGDYPSVALPGEFK